MKTNGLDKVLKQLKELDRRTKGGVVRALEAAGREGLAEMDRHIPVDQGKLRQSAGTDVDKDRLSLSLFVNAAYAPYVEFGTGSRVKVPAEFQDIAIKFKGKREGGGGFDDFLKQIIAWVKRKGITGSYSVKTRKRSSARNSFGETNSEEDERIAYLIAISILKKGIHPQPFVFPAYQKAKSVFIQQVEALVRSVS